MSGMVIQRKSKKDSNNDIGCDEYFEYLSLICDEGSFYWTSHIEEALQFNRYDDARRFKMFWESEIYNLGGQYSKTEIVLVDITTNWNSGSDFKPLTFTEDDFI